MSSIDPFEDLVIPLEDDPWGAHSGTQAAPDATATADLSRYMVDGASFVLDAPTTVPAIWGEGARILWAEGEALLIAAPPGVGKTTLAGQIVRGLLFGGTLLDLPIVPAPGRVLYLAMDRPRQIARSLRRHFDDRDRQVLAERLIVWKSPPPQDIARHPAILLELCRAAGASHVVVDSIKDAAIGLSEDEVGAGYNRARQMVISEGVDVLELHHMVKRNSEGKAPKALSDVYGSTWITSGVGSVIALHGEAGDLIVQFLHLKQPAETFGPLRIIHDHAAGITTIHHVADADQMIRLSGPKGITVRQYACAMFEVETPDRNQVERARRKLDDVVNTGRAERTEVPADRGGKPSTVYTSTGADPS